MKSSNFGFVKCIHAIIISMLKMHLISEFFIQTLCLFHPMLLIQPSLKKQIYWKAKTLKYFQNYSNKTWKAQFHFLNIFFFIFYFPFVFMLFPHSFYPMYINTVLNYKLNTKLSHPNWQKKINLCFCLVDFAHRDFVCVLSLHHHHHHHLGMFLCLRFLW